MRTCPNCGEALSAESLVCPNCGSSVEPEAPEAAPKSAAGKGKARIIGIVAAVVAVSLLAVGALTISGFFTSPAKKFISYHEELFVSELLSLVSDGIDRQTADTFSSDLTLTFQADNPSLNDYFEGWSLTFRTDKQKDSMVAKVELDLMDHSVVDATLTYEEGKLGFLVPQADHTYYVIDVAQYYKNQTGEELQQETQTRPDISGKQWSALIRAYLDIVYATVTKENVREAKNQSVTLPELGDSFTGTVYTFKPTAADVEQMLGKLADYLEKDEEIRELILQLMDSGSMTWGVSATWGILSDDLDAQAELEAKLEETLTEMARNMREEAGRLARAVEESGFTWTLAVEGDNVRQISITWDDDGLVYEAGGTKESGRAEVLYVPYYGARQELLRRSYSEKGGRAEGTVTLFGGREQSMTLEYHLDQNETSVLGTPYGEISLSFPGGGIDAVWSVGSGTQGGEDHILILRLDPNVYGDTLGANEVEIDIHATRGSTAVRPDQDPVDITDYSPEEISALLEKIRSALSGTLTYAFFFGRMSGSLYGW